MGLPENRKSPQITANQAQHNVILPENRKSPQITADKADGQSLTLCVLQIHLLTFTYLKPHKKCNKVQINVMQT